MKSVLNINIVDAFEVGRIQGAKDILAELLELSILDPAFQSYIKLKLKAQDEKLELINHYKILFASIKEE
jgi:hypothetical protein